MTEGETAIPLETTQCAFRNQEKPKQRSAISTRHTGGRVNLNFLAPPYGVAFLNPWNMPNKILASLNSKIKFEIHSINW